MKKVSRFAWGLLLVLGFAFVARGALAQGTPPSLEILSPVRGGEVPFGTVTVVAVSIFDLEGDIDLSTAELKVDGTDVIQDTNVSALLVTYEFTGAAPGKHTVEFSITDNAGNTASLESFFRVLGEPERDRKVTANGSIKAGAEYDKEAAQNVVGLLDANVYGRLSESVDYAVNVELTNEELSDGQRVSVYRLDLKTPVGTAVLGDATPYFGTYSISGQSVFGIHLQPQFGAIGFDILWGQLLRAVETPAEPDDPPETFKQMAWGGRFRVGRDPRKFLWGLSLLKVKDDIDSITPATVTPEDNLVIGTDLSFGLFKNVLSVKLEANESLLNEDITGGPMDFPDNKFGVDPEKIDWLFVVNDRMVPLVPNGLSNLAARAAFTVGPVRDNTLNAEFSYVGPSYYSLANPGIVNDRAGFRAWDTLWLLDKKLFLNAAGQYYEDSLADSDEPDATKSYGVTGGFFAYPTDLLTFNAGVDYQRAKNDAAAPEQAVNTTNTTINGGINRDFTASWANSNVYLTQSVTLFTDEAPLSALEENTFATRLGAVSYFTGMPLDTRAVVGADFGDIDASVYLQGRAGYRFLKDESLYAFADTVYESGPELLDLKLGVDWSAPIGLVFESDLQYLDSPGFSDVIVSAYVTKYF